MEKQYLIFEIGSRYILNPESVLCVLTMEEAEETIKSLYEVFPENNVRYTVLPVYSNGRFLGGI